MLCDVLDVLIYRFIEGAVIKVHDSRLINETASVIGAYLFDFRNQSISDLRILGHINDAWEKLIKLLSRDSKQVNGVACADQSLVHFLQCFQEVLLSCYQARQKLYDLGKISQYKKLRRVLLKMLVQRSDLIPTSRNTESELLVQLLAEFWDCDRQWVIEKQTRLQAFRTLLGQLQQGDAAGSGGLADQIAYFLAH